LSLSAIIFILVRNRYAHFGQAGRALSFKQQSPGPRECTSRH
jgi:hypothetical protein